ncbi:DUF7662 domain-containing protein [Aurantimonas sp. E1-2-R+4]|uniref:DUF7662 domain-containing protein n=1 Tax=Aurantimonas sp. E1-2-R+4 TaxID=3113714 RepID=UPI003FA5C5CA
MGKYDPLRDHLRKQTASEITLTFDKIANLVGALPKTANRPQYWENAAKLEHETPPRRATREAGYRSFLIAGADRVRFVRED